MIIWKKLEKGRKLSRRMKFQGMDISIETDKGEEREWYDPHNNEKGTTKMKFPYGYIRRTDGADGEQVDVYVGPNESSKDVYVIRQNKAPDFEEYDEDKVMVGFNSPKEAKEAYLVHYNSPKFFDSINKLNVEEFKDMYIKKAFNFGEQGNQEVPSIDLNDMNNPEAVQLNLKKVSSMNDKEIVELNKTIWGDGYQITTTNLELLREELKGFLQDQLEYLNTIHPMFQNQDMQATPNLPHSPGPLPQSTEKQSLSTEDSQNQSLEEQELTPTSLRS